MSRNRRRHANPFPMRALSPWFVIAAILLIGGMTWVYFKNQLVTRGREIKDMEKQLVELNTGIEALRPKIAALSSRTALQHRLDEGVIQMIPIRQDRIVQVSFNQPAETAQVNEIRAVSNERISR